MHLIGGTMQKLKDFLETYCSICGFFLVTLILTKLAIPSTVSQDYTTSFTITFLTVTAVGFMLSIGLRTDHVKEVAVRRDSANDLLVDVLKAVSLVNSKKVSSNVESNTINYESGNYYTRVRVKVNVIHKQGDQFILRISAHQVRGVFRSKRETSRVINNLCVAMGLQN
jgi:hypothetical protein